MKMAIAHISVKDAASTKENTSKLEIPWEILAGKYQVRVFFVVVVVVVALLVVPDLILFSCGQ